ncbi:MAG: hypothetical protein H7Z73_01090 [Candidatus Saccharibacteria bacterium]|nr:hypothetical protein [Moraxellaceae bacterium]
MYFWRIEKLKASMATAQLTEREVLPYLIATMILLTVAFGAMRHMPVTSYWDDINSILNILFAIIGTIYIYHKNNGAAGRNFLQRYIVISWVVGNGGLWDSQLFSLCFSLFYLKSIFLQEMQHWLIL